MIMAAVAATVIGIVGGTAWTVVTHEPAPVPADSAAAEVSAVAGQEEATHGDESPGGEAAGSDSRMEDEPQGPPPATHAPAETPVPTASAVASPAASRQPTPEADPDPGADDEGAGADQLARIFTAMQPRDAARVLSQMTDAEIREILTRMGARQAASVLSNMEPERAAVLSRTVLDGGRGPR